jgi:galactokinase
MTPRDRAIAAFRTSWGEDPALVARAPGRVNLIGEHTDYNDGFVLPCALEFETVVAASLGEMGVIEAVAVDSGHEHDRFALAPPVAHAGGWRDYVRGMASVLGETGPLTGARLAIAGNVPLGSGLSSSAALELAIGRALLELAERTMPPSELARAAQRAENHFVGCACGIMDQLISARGMAGHALLIDCRSLDCTPVVMPADASIVIVNSGVRHTHAGGEYNERRAQCEAAARHYGVVALRDIDVAQLEAGATGLDPLTYRRARHVVTENARTLAAADALAAADLRAMGVLMRASHTSMRDDFEITVPAIDRLADLANDLLGDEGGARMTGGGFGGCVVALAPHARVPELRTEIAAHYRTPDGNAPDIHVCQAASGADSRWLR